MRRAFLPPWAVTSATEALVGRMLMSVTLVGGGFLSLERAF
jgi:hypothetical protein